MPRSLAKSRSLLSHPLSHRLPNLQPGDTSVAPANPLPTPSPSASPSLSISAFAAHDGAPLLPLSSPATLCAISSALDVQTRIIPTPPPSAEPELEPKTESIITRKCAIVDFPGRGEDLVATHDIKQGELIIAEEALCSFDCPVFSLDIHVVLEQKTRRQKEVSLNLTHNIGEKDGYIDIVSMNLIPLPEVGDDKPSRCGMFEFSSRIHHFCTPNAVWTWSTEDVLKLSRLWH